MKILRIRIQNVNSLRGTSEIDFTQPPLVDAGLLAIVGDTGAGKSTLLDAMTLALYGRTARLARDVQEVMTYGTTECAAEVDFSNRGTTYRATWNLYRAYGKPDGKVQPARHELSIYRPEQDAFELVAEKISEVRQLVPELTGLDYDRFTRSVLLTQGEFAAFLRASERDRSELLERITGTTIYSELSAAAFQRHKLEREALSQLEQHLAQLDLLSPDEWNALEAERNALEEKVQSDRQVLQRIDAQIKTLLEIGELEQQIAELQFEKANLHQERTDRAQEEARFRQARRIQPLSQWLFQWRDATEQRTRCQRQLEAQAQELAELRQALSAATDRSQTAQQAWTATEQYAQERRRLFELVERLDTQLTGEKTELKEATDRLARRQDATRAVEAELGIQTKRINQLENTETTLRQWLTEQATHAHLPTTIQSAGQLYEQFEEVAQLVTDRTAEYEQLVEQSGKLGAQLRRLREEWTNNQKQEAHLLAQFDAALPEGYTTDRSAILEQLAESVEGQNERLLLFERGQSVFRDYQRWLAEEEHIERELQELQTREEELIKELLTLSDQLADALEQRTFQEAIFRQQQLIANYEQDRGQLVDGAPCPLCGSEHHPYAHGALTPYVDKAKLAFEQADRSYQRLQKRNGELLAREEQLLRERRRLLGDDSATSSIAGIRRKLELLEADLADIQQQLPGTSWRADVDVVQELRLQRDQLRDRLQRLRALQQEQQDVQRQSHLLETQVLKLEADTQGLQAQTNRLAGQLDQDKARQSTLADRLQKLFDEYDLAFHPASAPTDMANLRQLYTRYQEQEATLKAVEADLLQATATKTRQEKERARLLSECATEEQQLQKRIARVGELEKDRKDRFGTAAVADERAALQQRLQTAREEAERSQSDVYRIQEQLAAVQSQGEAFSAELMRQEEIRTTALEALAPRLPELGISTPEAALAQLPDPVELEALETTFQELDRRQAENDRLLQKSAEQLERKQQTLPDQTELSALRGRYAQLELKQEEQQQRLGRQRGRLEQQVQLQQRSKELMEQLDRQQDEVARWAKLNELIGQADGKKFRIFAQGLTLQRLVGLANRHLLQLNGRYQIHKPGEAELDLEIIDTYQANHHRSMLTLSGGETFLVSLALALGLSDLAGRDTRIQSLFIDEGFGTLDEKSLDLALTTLENLQADGKQIGLISHVRALKERIHTQIQVIKDRNGFSRIEVV